MSIKRKLEASQAFFFLERLNLYVMTNKTAKLTIKGRLLLLIGMKPEQPVEHNLQWILRVDKQPNGMYNLIDILNQH